MMKEVGETHVLLSITCLQVTFEWQKVSHEAPRIYAG